jgi:uncharacterized membrane protein HdeD (DUF308 family)
MSLTLTQGIIFLLYVTFLVIKFKGPLPSISDSWYELKKLGGVWYSLFTWFCYSLGVLMFFQTNGTAPALFFISGAGLCFVGVATQFMAKESIEPWIHFTGVALCVLGALVGIGVERHNWLPLTGWAFSTAIIEVLHPNLKNKTWWVEIAAFTFIIIGLLFTR